MPKRARRRIKRKCQSGDKPTNGKSNTVNITPKKNAVHFGHIPYQYKNPSGFKQSLQRKIRFPIQLACKIIRPFIRWCDILFSALSQQQQLSFGFHVLSGNPLAKHVQTHTQILCESHRYKNSQIRIRATSVVGSRDLWWATKPQKHASNMLTAAAAELHFANTLTPVADRRKRGAYGVRGRGQVHVYICAIIRLFFCLPKVAVDADVAIVAAVRVAFLAATCQLPHSLFGFEAARVAKRTVSPAILRRIEWKRFFWETNS